MIHFKISEFGCPCGCSKNEMDKNLLERLDDAREYAETPFIISSGYRCSNHNKMVGGSETSSHLKGLAVDVAVKNSIQRYKILSGFIGAGFTRIGIGKTFIHTDCDNTKTPGVIWIY